MAKRKFDEGDRVTVGAKAPRYERERLNGHEGTIIRWRPADWGGAGWYDVDFNGTRYAFYAYQMDKVIPPPDLNNIW